jgi:DNA helicase II / ATP-dependent DNA helicase PcrA
MARALADEEQVDEERRLMYVALTRARNHLFVTYPMNVYDTRRSATYTMDQLSRFLDRGVREGMQRVVVENPDRAPEAEKGPLPVVDLRALLRGRFGA